MKLILLRHATTDWNLVHRIQGHTDITLNQQGRTEAAEWAAPLSNLGITIIISSDLARARETAEIINASLKVPLRIDLRLRECAWGKIEGLTKEQAIEQYVPWMANWETYHIYDLRPFGGEGRDDVLARHLQLLESLARELPDATVLLVGHSRGLRTLLAGLGYPPNLYRSEFRVIEYIPNQNHNRP